MKRFFTLLIAATLLLCGLAACGTATPQPVETQATTEPTEIEFPTQLAEVEYTTQAVKAEIDPNFDAEALFKRLEGVWDDDSEYLGFTSFVYKDGKPSLYCGAYDGDTSGVGALTGGRENEEGVVTLYFLYPAVDDVDGPIPERTTALQIDLTGIADGKLDAQQTTIWMTYERETLTYRCKTLREAGIRAIW